MKANESPSKNEIYEFMDLLARAYVIFRGSLFYSYIQAMADYEDVCEKTKSKMDKLWADSNTIADFLQSLESEIADLEKASNRRRYIVSEVICMWMDHSIMYEPLGKNTEAINFSVHELIPFWGRNEILQIDAMNTNYEKTGIQIIPKLDIAEILSKRNGANNLRANATANRDAFVGLNGVSTKVCFVTWSSKTRIHNLILPSRALRPIDNVFNIAFCPWPKDKVLNTEAAKFTRNDITYNGRIITGMQNPEQLLERFKADWEKAVTDGEAHIIFFPESIGTEAMEETENGGKENRLIKQMALAISRRGVFPPLLTVLPSYSKDGINSATIVDRNGCIIGRQKKNVPYVNVKKHEMEALVGGPEEYYIIHIPNVHRIIILICAEFLDICNRRNLSLFTEACCTLVLVPSFTKGEQDFLNAMQTLKCYGVTVIWGNNCGISIEKIIGACSMPGYDCLKRFSEIIDCTGGCKGNETCAFVVSLPLKLSEFDSVHAEDIRITRIYK